jgi:PhnB protein
VIALAVAPARRQRSAKPIPNAFPCVSPHVSVAGAAAIDFYTAVLGASERMRMATPRGAIAHAEVAIGRSVIMIGEDAPGAATLARRR